MKVVLVAPPILDLNDDGHLRPWGMDAVRACPPYGLYLLAAVLERDGHDVVLADLVLDGGRSLMPYAREVEAAGLVGVSATSLGWPTALDVVRQVRAMRPDVPVVAGGIHPTMFDRHVLRTSPVDLVVRGEGEVALSALCHALERGSDLAGVPSLSWKPRDGGVARNPGAAKIPSDELTSFPIPRYDRLPRGSYRSLALETSRGCAFDCSFCSTAYRRSWRAMPAMSVVDRIEAAMAHLDRTRMRTIHIVDDEFSMNPRRATAIAREVARRGLFPRLLYDSRAPDMLADAFLDAIEPFTFRLLVGAECGYDEGLRRVGKGTTCAVLESAAAALARRGMAVRTDFSFIIGLPWETRAEAERTMAFAARLGDRYGVTILLNWYCQIPGSRLWEEDRRAERVHESMYDEYGFSRNLYLFRSGVRLSPADVWHLADAAVGLRRDGLRVEFAVPPPVARYFPREAEDDALGSLRELVRVGAPRRRL